MVDGLTPIWPIDLEGNHRCWRYVPESMQALIDTKRVVLGRYNKERDSWTVNYWVRKSESKKLKTVWWNPLHDAGTHGTILLQKLFGKRNTFPFPKSLYAVRDCIAAVVRDRPDALIIDFFAGSGTTMNAVNLLNLSDDGRRRCIQVTNNEVGDKAADHLRAIGREPGDPEWEDQGICRAVTWPRSKFTILGRRDDGNPLPGEYLTGKTVERARARRFIQIGFIDPATLDTPAKKRQLVALIEGLPQTLVTDPCPFIVSENHAATVLFDDAAAEDWLAALDGQDQVRDLYILTPAKRRFEALKAEAAEILGPILFNEEERRPLAAGFPANLAYFRLDFLDQDRVALRRAFREILPLLWLKAGAIGHRPEWPPETPEPPFFAPAGNPFAVLLDEGRLPDLIESLAGRVDLRMLFIVTDSQDSFRELTAEAGEALGRHHPGLRTIQLYRDYLENFLINRETAGGRS
jgi:adenine-specific DNA-methyltransferase